MAYHSFLVEPISCHAWNKDRTRELTWGGNLYPWGVVLLGISWAPQPGSTLGTGSRWVGGLGRSCEAKGKGMGVEP